MIDSSWKKITVLFLCCFYTVLSYSQMRGTYNYLDFANKPYYYGMKLGYNSSKYQVIHGKDFILNDTILNVESLRGPGFSLGGIFNLKVGHYFDCRIMPTFALAERRIAYKTVEAPDNLVVKRFSPTYLEIPFHIRYKSEPYHDFRVFVIAGIKYSYDFSSDFKTHQSFSLVKISPSDFAVEYGAGIQIFFPYFIFSPEFKVSHGISNILISNDELIFSSVIDRLMSRSFEISFHFEG